MRCKIIEYCIKKSTSQTSRKSLRTSTCLTIAALLLELAAPCQAASTPTTYPGFTHVRTVQDISEYRLDANGLTVLLLPFHSAPAVTMMVTYRVGSRNESYGTTGATHLLEHLMFKGTREHNRDVGAGFDQLLERTGAMTNATTSQDRTNYFETTGSQDLPLSVQLEADRMRGLRLLETDRRPEMTVVRNEYERGENNPSEALEKEVWATAYIAHPYHHSTIGWHSDFERVPIEKLREFYNTFYWPNNATVTVIGDFDPANALKLVKQNYGKIPRAPHKIPDVYTEEPPQTGPRRVVVQRPGELGVVMIVQKVPPGTHPDYAPLRVLGMILSDGRNSRFYQALTDKNLTTDVSAYPEFNHDPTLFSMTSTLTPATKHQDVEDRMLKEVERVQKDGVKQDEVAAAIAKYVASTSYERDGSMNMAFALNECIAVGDWPLYYKLEDSVKHVTADDVQRVAKKYFSEDQRTTGWYIPRNEKPAHDADGQAIEKRPPLIGDAIIGSGKPDDAQHVNSAKLSAEVSKPQPPKPPKALARTEQASSAGPPATKIAPQVVRKRTHGIDLLVCPTHVKDVVTIEGSFPAYDPKTPLLGELAAEMLERGTKKHTAEQLATLLDKVGAQTGFSFEAGNIKFVAHCLKKDSAQVVSLLADQLIEPNFPSEEFEKLRKQKLAEAHELRENTDAQAMIAFRRAVFHPGDPQYRMSPEERIAALEKIGVEDVKAYHSKYFGPEYATMVVVGDIETEKIRSQVAESFAAWNGGQPLPKTSPARPVAAAKDLTVPIPGKESVSVIMGEPTGLHYTDADYLPLAVGTSVLGQGFAGRLLGTVRDQEGLTYDIAAQLTGSGKLEQSWVIVATFNPKLLKQGLTSTRREITNWHEGGITAAELDYRKSALAGAHNVSLATSSGLAESILSTVLRGRDLSWIDEYPKKVAALKLDDVNETIRKHIDPNKLVTAEAGTIEDK